MMLADGKRLQRKAVRLEMVLEARNHDSISSNVFRALFGPKQG
jgi:hypothetical protein